MRSITLVAVVCCVIAAHAAEDLSARATRLIKDLDSDHFNVRDAASDAILDLPGDALPFVEEAAKASSAEARARLDKCLPVLRFKQKSEPARKRIAEFDAKKVKSIIASYEACSTHGAAWDAKGRETVRLMAMGFGHDPAETHNEFRSAAKAGFKALEAGCDDPLVTYFFGRVLQINQADPANSREMILKAAPLMEKSKYPAYWRVQSMLRAAQELAVSRRVSEEDKKESRRLCDAALAIIPEILRDTDFTITDRIYPLEMMLDTFKALTGDRKVGYDLILAMLKKEMPDSVIVNLVTGHFYKKYAWDARGDGWANTVTEEGARLMNERLDLAAKEFEAAWAKDPTDGYGPHEMLGVELGQGKGRDRMELWFKRAIENDPHNTQAYADKAWYLQPRWHGSAEESLEFGRECLRLHLWECEIHRILDSAHLSLCGDDREKYFSNPSVWADIQAAYEPYLQRYPNAVHSRIDYARRAYWAQQYEVATEQINLLPKSDQDEVADLKANCALKSAQQAVNPQPGSLKAPARRALVRDWEDAGGDFRVGDWIETKYLTTGATSRREVIQVGNKMTVTEIKQGDRVIRWKERYIEDDPLVNFGNAASTRKIECKVEPDKATIPGKGEFSCQRRDTYMDGKIIMREWLCKDIPFGGPIKMENASGLVTVQLTDFGRGTK